ncbi:MAG: hypothetical protein HZA68_04510 [Rhodovulum sp.]|nr:hypothetical protein [Rhodovulum sp.]
MNPQTASERTTEPPQFFIGRDSRNRWVVRDHSGRRGGFFVDRAEALRYALFENGRRPQAVMMVPGVLELDLSGRAAAPLPCAVMPCAVPPITPRLTSRRVA